MPRFPRPIGFRCVCLIAVAVSLLRFGEAGGLAQTATRSELQAAFLVNFAKFTEWPADALATDARLTMCVAEAPALAEALELMTRTVTVGGRRIATERRDLKGLLKNCHLLFAPDLDGARAAGVLTSLNGSATLSVSDTGAFTRAGGVAHLYVEGDRMRFAFNVAAADRARLRVSSRMLVLARIVTEERP